MAVTADDVRRIADLARLRVQPDEIAAMATQLSAILDHMRVLTGTDTGSVAPADGVGSHGAPLRTDDIHPVSIAIEGLAPRTRDGFLLVPRLATHGDSRGDR